MDAKVSYLLDRSQPFGADRVQILDQLSTAMATGSPQQKEAHEIWNRLKQDDYFWYNSDKILEMSKVNETKVYTLVILEEAIKQKWFALPEDQRDSLKAYIVNVVLEYGAASNLPKPLHNILSKANSILVQIVKYEWNTTWTSFISDICTASLKDMNICQNNFSILKMLSEEIFDYSKNQMTQKQIANLKEQMVKQFTTIYQLCKLILQNLAQAKESLIKACLETLHAFLSWIPMYYIICTDLIQKLVLIIRSDYLRPQAMFCLVEIAGLKIDIRNREEVNKFLSMLKSTTIQISKILPLITEKDEIKKFKKQIQRRQQTFQLIANNITMFYSQFFKQQNYWIFQQVDNNNQMIQVCKVGLNYMLMIMKVDNEQNFKICIQFFHFYIGSYIEKASAGQFVNMNTPMHAMNKQVFLQVMRVISLKMAKPEEVLIVIDEDGMPVRESLQNTENSSLYEIMKELTAYLVKIDWLEMKKFIISQIQDQQTNQFNFDSLNSLSWIVGSLWGSILQKQEKTFFITSLRTLLHLCENKKGKQNKAVIASCIMYVVGQYPTFLRTNWTFLRTVIKKLFEFMKEDFPGIMEMACNAFLKIAKSTADQFIIQQPNQKQPYIREIIRKIPQQTQKLGQDSLKLTFYLALAYIIGAQKNSQVQVELIQETLGMHLYEFQNIISATETNIDILRDEEVKKKILYFLKINETLATGVGQQYALFLKNISEVINKLCLFYSIQISQSIQKQGKNSLNFVTVKAMRSIKKQVLKIYIKYLQQCDGLNNDQAQYILNNFIFPLGTLLKDFQDSAPQAKQQQFVVLFTLVLTKLSQVITPTFLSTLVEMIFSSSLPLITTDFNSFPEIRANFFAFLKALIKYNFHMLYSLDEDKFNLILDCVIWSLKHELSTFSDLGLDLLQDIFTNVNSNTNVINAFYPKYHMKILADILQVMTDGFHKSGLESQSKIFYILIQIAKSNILALPIDQNQPAGKSNYSYLYQFLVQKLSNAFPNTSKNTTIQKVNNWFELNDEQAFKLEIADYLVLINRYTPAEITESQKDPKNGLK